MEWNITDWGVPQWIVAAMYVVALLSSGKNSERNSTQIERILITLLWVFVLGWGGFWK